MHHLDDGALRRLCDEPAAIPAVARRHYATCARCQGKRAEIAADARAAATLLAVGNVRADPAVALTQTRQRIAAESGVHARRWHQRWYERMGAMGHLNSRRLVKPVGSVIAAGKTLPSMPAGLDGSTLQVTIGPAVVATYGGDVGSVIGGAKAGNTGNGQESEGGAPGGGTLPTLVVAEAAQPRVTSTGASVKEIEDYLLAQPGVSPQLASQIKAIGGPSTTLPIPIPVDRATAQTVQVQGVSGLAVGDNTGLGSGVIWEKDGVVYGVAGALPESQILTIANSLQ